MRSFFAAGCPPLPGCITSRTLKETTYGRIHVLEMLELRNQRRQLKHLADRLVNAAQLERPPAAGHLIGGVEQRLQALAVNERNAGEIDDAAAEVRPDRGGQ